MPSLKPEPDRPSFPRIKVLVAEFLPLPELDQSQFGRSKTLSRSYDFLKGVRELVFLFRESRSRGKHEEKLWRVRHPSGGGLEDQLELAQFELLPDALDFQWTQSGLKKGRFQKLSRLLRDSVLKVETGDRTDYFMMRNPPLLSSKAMSLTRVGPQTDGIKPQASRNALGEERARWKDFRGSCSSVDGESTSSPKEHQDNGWARERTRATQGTRWQRRSSPNGLISSLRFPTMRLVIDLDFHREVIFEQSNQLNDLRLEADELELELKSRSRQEDTAKRLAKLKQEIQVIDPKDEAI